MSDDLCQPYTGRLVPSETTDSTNPKLAKADEENCSIHGPFYSGYPECPFCMAGGLIGSHATGGQEEAVEPRAEPYFIAEMRRVCTQSKQNELVKFSVYTEDVGQALYEFDLRGPRIPPPDDVCPVSPQRLYAIADFFYQTKDDEPAKDLTELAAWLERRRV